MAEPPPNPAPNPAPITSETKTPEDDRSFYQIGIDWTWHSYQNIKPKLRSMGGLLFATIFAISHHALHRHYEHLEVNKDTQFMIKVGSNALSQLVVACLGLSTTHTLILSMWATSRRSTLASTIDDLFSLPEALPLLSLVFSKEIRLVVVLAIFLRLLAIITTLVPNSLSAVSTSSNVEQVVVPTLDLSQGNIHAVARGVGDPTYGLWSGLTDNHRKLVWRMISSSSTSLWPVPPPPMCGSYCNFGMRFTGPTLHCRESSAGQPSPSPSGLSSNIVPLYQAESSLLTDLFIQDGLPGREYRYDINSTYDFVINYSLLTSNGGQSNHSVAGAMCEFQQSLIQSTIQFTDSQPYILTNITYERPLGGNRDCVWTPGQDVPSCWVEGVNTRALCQAFVEAFSGSIQFNTTSDSRTNVTVGNPSALDIIFGHESQVFGLDFGVKNLSNHLEQTFLGVIFGMIQYQNESTTVQLVLARHTVWEYNASVLVGLYVTFTSLTFIASLYGFALIKADATIPTDRNFTTVVFTSRGRRLHETCQDTELKTLQEEKLIYLSGGEKVWIPDGREPQEPGFGHKLAEWCGWRCGCPPTESPRPLRPTQWPTLPMAES